MEGQALIQAWFTKKNGSLSELKKLLEEGVEVDSKDANGRTLLHHATNNGQRDIVKYLLENNADVFSISNDGITAFHVAVLNNDKDTVKFILENISRGKARKLIDTKIASNGNAALHIAAENNFYTLVFFLLRYGANFEITNNADKKPVDLASFVEARQFLQMIGVNFARVRNQKQKLIEELQGCNILYFELILNCRNNQGYTIMQELIRSDDDKFQFDLMNLRLERLIVIPDWESLYHCSRSNEIEKLSQRLKECQEFWLEHWDAVYAYIESNEDSLEMVRDVTGRIPTTYNAVATNALKIGCGGLEKAHQVLLAYRKFIGQSKLLILETEMKMLEEVIEALGFDSDQMFVIVGKEACYYEKLPAQWKEDFESFLFLMESIVYGLIKGYAYRINCVSSINAVNDDNVDKVENLLNNKEFVDGFAVHKKTPLCLAVEKNNQKIVDLILASGADVVLKGLVSPIYVAVCKGNAKMVNQLLKHVKSKDISEFLDQYGQFENAALHEAAKIGQLEIVRILLSYGATYSILDAKGRTPLDISRDRQVSALLKLVDDCFVEATKAKVEFIHKLKQMQTQDFMAIANCKNRKGLTLATVCAKAGGKNISIVILRMIKEAK